MDFSVVIPVYNEEKNLPLLHKALQNSLAGINKSWEVVYINDGSQDNSVEVLDSLYLQDPKHVRVIMLRRNFGQTPAMSAGIDLSVGDVIVMMDADMQNDPADIPMLLKMIDDGYDLVSGWRKNRKDAFISRTLPSRVANWLISKITRIKLHDYGCTLKAYRREILTGFRLYGEMHRFIPAYAGYVGAKITEVVVQHHPRRFGKTNYGLERTFKVILDLFTVSFLGRFGQKPIYVFGGLGMGLVGLGGIGFIYLAYRKFIMNMGIGESSFLILSTMLIILGFQSLLMGIIAEMVVRTYHESQAKPVYSIRSTKGFSLNN